MDIISPQEIDSLKIEIIVDNHTDSLSSTPDFVNSEFSRFLGRPFGKISGRCLCCAGHGLSLLITATSGDTTSQVLFDAGPDEAIFARNLDVLEIDLSSVDDIVLSHGHWDHAAGLQEAVRRANPSGDRRCPVHVNKGMFVQRGVRAPGGKILPFEDIPGVEALQNDGGLLVSDDGARVIGKGLFYLSGEIARTTAFETGFAGHVAFDQSSGQWVDDPLIMDERYLAVKLRDRGWVVFSACSHAGAVNVVRDLSANFKGAPLFALMGGLHLSGIFMESKIGQTVDGLAEADLQYIFPAHCTGWRAVSALSARFGEDVVVPCAVGQTFNF